jgi:glycosyltransferase involved in cell wall biosynthesis
MTSATTVSVVIPARDAEPFIAETVRSVLGQSHPPLECLVVDDGSSDRTAEVVEGIGDPRARVIRRQGEGSVALARNEGMATARGELIAFLDADDVWHPSKLERQVAQFDRRPGLGISWCGYVITGPSLEPRFEIRPNRSQMDLQAWLMLEGNGILVSSTGVVRADVVEAIGGFRPELSVSADLDFAERAVSRYEADAVDDVLVAYRGHPGQMHRRLHDLEHDVRWLLDDRFRDHPRRLAHARANLATRLLAYNLRHGEVRSALRYVPELWPRPDRLVRLPAEAVARRLRRRGRARVAGVADPRRWWDA